MWRRDTHFAGVRDPAALGQLPENEQREWRKLWSELATILSKIDTPRVSISAD
jgi:hypothetical protein